MKVEVISRNNTNIKLLIFGCEAVMKQSAGFNLLELMITIAILAIVLAVSFSFDGNLLQRDRAQSFLQELQRNIAFARVKATASDEIVILCPAPPESIQNRAPFACADDWATNRISVFVDRNNDGQFNNNDTLHRVMEVVNTSDNMVFSGDNRLRFDSSGLLSGAATGNFTYCPGSEDNNQQLSVSQAGTALYRGDTEDQCN
ncbi:GspH/FimT family pseudopilin [Pseudoalteromonas sp. McH1-7]|uniref:Type II secretion system protein H n=2 Tax=Pseudoalteromonas TaxID=53246 RepID=A0A8I0T430_9GAMM|nr:type IV fimbrial biogenesis protein FimT [Pseudoalteromonas peptidolytica F12-50-A1]NLR14355.1 prepilin-type N-terminal cleavage/methylation domain-containing protein [Pseudoalteromonas peptidolytica]NUZ12823.1 GspH/FimT family pseudopilin [Pseudoalteromonas sp. McH1-7]RXF02232.1 prepilin-type N-terminal cleavage/methylation domain-containing protein [Pseudoalteromonas sp. PS5]USD27564.1 GspH/FimT family pseudopilin [Pseudoalteromonas sp. SCSIO 43201]